MNMKRLLSFTALLALSPCAFAQNVFDNGPELIVSGFFDSGPTPDIAIVDKQTGQVRTGTNNNTNFTWSGPLLSGLADVSAATSGKLGLPLNEGLLLTSRGGNKLARVSPLDAASPPVIYTVPLGAPSGAVALDYLSGPSPTSNTNGLWLSSGDFETAAFSESLTFHTPSGTALSAPGGTRGVGFPLTQGQRVRLTSGGNLLAGYAAPTAGRVQVYEAQASGIPAQPWRPQIVAEFSNIAADVQFTHEYFLPGGQAMFLFTATGGSNVYYAPATSGFTVVSNWVDTGMDVAFVVALNVPGAQGFIAFPRNALPAKFYAWNGTDFTLRQTMAVPPGGKWMGALPGAGLMLLHGPADGSGTTGWQHWPLQGNGQFVNTVSGTVPPRTLASSAHVFAFTQEPFVGPFAAMTDARRVTDWTSGPLPLPSTRLMSVTRETYAGAAPGLGTPVAFNVGTAPVGSAWMLANQYAPDVSVAALSSEKISIAAPTVEISPPPRHTLLTSATPAVSDVLSFSPSGGALVFYRTGPGLAFRQYDSAAPPVIQVFSLPQTNTVEYFATAGSARSRLHIATYTYGPAREVDEPANIDTDGDGLSDAWEKYYGLTDPNGDADGDGMNNLTEQNSGSDPLGPCRPGELPDLTINFAGGDLQIHLTRALVPGEVLERSNDLATWQPLTVPASSAFVLDPVTATRRYYRLRR
jgi:hypothetical protein